MVTKEKVLSLSDFFTYEYQCKLIKNAQMVDANYENAIIEYAKLFMVDLIKAMCDDADNGRNLNQVALLERVMDNTSCKQIEPSVFELQDKEKEKPLREIDVSPITEFFLKIRQVYHCWTSCDINTAIDVLKDLFRNKLKVSELDKREVPKNESLYRGRISEKSLEKVDMFHIPFMKAYKIRNQRFSITGQPLLYLSSSVFGVFNELSVTDNNYEKLYVAQYRFKQYDEKKIYVYDLTIDGSQLLQQKEPELFNKLLYRFILGCVCSFPNIRGRDNSFFIEEYVIPQLVTQLIKSKYSYNGICYNTLIYDNIEHREEDAVDNEQKKNVICKIEEKYINYAFFTEKRNANASMDNMLRDLFIIDEPITVMDVPGYKSEMCSLDRKDIITLLSGYYSDISSKASVSEKIRTTRFFEQLEREVNWLYRDGEYRYIVEKCGKVTSQEECTGEK